MPRSTKPTRSRGKGRAQRPFSRRSVTLSGDRAAEFFIGGLTGCLQIADKLKLRASVGAALISAISMALPDLPMKGIVRAYHRIGGEVPVEIGAKMLAATARKPRRKPR